MKCWNIKVVSWPQNSFWKCKHTCFYSAAAQTEPGLSVVPCMLLLYSLLGTDLLFSGLFLWLTVLLSHLSPSLWTLFLFSYDFCLCAAEGKLQVSAGNSAFFIFPCSCPIPPQPCICMQCCALLARCGFVGSDGWLSVWQQNANEEKERSSW